MKKTTRFFGLLGALIFTSLIAFSQESSDIKNAGLNWVFKEKVKLTPEQMLKMGDRLNEQQVKTLKEYLQANMLEGERDLTNGTEIEAEIHAAINPVDSNNIVVSPIRQDMTAGVMSCPVYYTKDFGETWAISPFQNMPHEVGAMSVGGGDPVFAYDADGKLYFTWIDLYGGDIWDMLINGADMGIFWAYSDDGGETWNKPVHDTVLLGNMNPLTGAVSSPVSDKQWMATDRTQSATRNNLYICYVTIGQVGSVATYQINCKTKPAGIDEFTIEAPVTQIDSFDLVQFSSLTVDGSGNVHVVFYGVQGGVGSIWHSVSVDGGNTFSNPNKVSNMAFNLPLLQVQPYDTIPGINADRTYPSPYMAGDPTSGNIYVTWTSFGVDAPTGTGSDVYFSRSVDNGMTWSPAIVVNDDGGIAHNYYSSIFVKPNGEVKVSWYDRRSDPAGYITNYFYATSDDGGASFGPNLPATTQTTDFSTVGSQNQGFGIGEYTQILASDGYTIPVWCDGRGNDGNMNVYISFINDLTVGKNRITSISDNFGLQEIYPNPVNTTATVNFQLPDNSEVSIYITDVMGKIVKEINGGEYKLGTSSIELDLNDLSSGTYYCILRTNSDVASRQFVVVK